MRLFFPRPSFLAGAACASMLLFLACPVTAHAQSQTYTVSDPLKSLGGGPSFVLPNFNAGLGTLTDVTLTMFVDNKNFTIFDTNNPQLDCVSLDLVAKGSLSKINADALAAWDNASGNLDVTYTKPADRTVASMGVAGLLLYCTPINGVSDKIDINYTYSPQAVPEPGSKYLSALAAGAMALLLAGRNLRRRASAASLS
jgi:hypothetical protein